MSSEKEKYLHNLLCVLNSLNHIHDAAFFLESTVEDDDDANFYSEIRMALTDAIELHDHKLEDSYCLVGQPKPEGLISDNTLVEEEIALLERKLSYIVRKRQLSRK